MLSGSRHHGMDHPQVTGRGEGLQKWREAANILNKQSQTADRWWPSTVKKKLRYEPLHSASNQDEFFGTT
jgi:hypothetical protein